MKPRSELEKALMQVPTGEYKNVKHELLDLCAVGYSTFTNWKTGKKEPKTALKIKINKYFGKTIYPVNL